MPKIDFDTIPTDDLVKALLNRGETIVIVREQVEKVGEEREMMLDYAGGMSSSLGLLMRAQLALLDDCRMTREDRSAELNEVDDGDDGED